MFNVKEMLIKTWNTIMPTRLGRNLRSLKIPSVDRDTEQKVCWWRVVTWYKHFGRQFGVTQEMPTLWPRSSTPRHIALVHVRVSQQTCPKMFIAAWFVIAKNEKIVLCSCKGRQCRSGNWMNCHHPASTTVKQPIPPHPSCIIWSKSQTSFHFLSKHFNIFL